MLGFIIAEKIHYLKKRNAKRLRQIQLLKQRK